PSAWPRGGLHPGALATELVLPRVQYRRQCDNGRGGDADSGYGAAQSRRGRGSSSIGRGVVRSGLWERGLVGGRGLVLLERRPRREDPRRKGPAPAEQRASKG